MAATSTFRLARTARPITPGNDMSRPFAHLTGAVSLAASLLLPGFVAAAPLVPGDMLPKLELSDQHNRPVVIDGSTRLLIFAADKAGGDLAQGVLKAQDAGVLARIHAVYLADISAMPALISTMFAMPKLRELPFAVGIVRDAAKTAQLPRQPDQVTVLVLDAGQVRQVLQAGNPNTLKQALGL
jgi:hypothetical protein